MKTVELTIKFETCMPIEEIVKAVTEAMVNVSDLNASGSEADIGKLKISERVEHWNGTFNTNLGKFRK